MPKNNQHINIVCEQPLFSEMSELAKSEGKSLSSLALDLIREALELREDSALASIADERAKTYDRKLAGSVEQALED